MLYFNLQSGVDKVPAARGAGGPVGERQPQNYS
jgi:hypothetical protein